eukprot:CAMPEP_0197828150 /NCGR_PEP_ID=MMETSP1437-20131217/4787_1 /TAXON_ID=49252 ORGANISM="Eucampia antarctica, Strain CCMP1452" /NCGR_SAMPLE_ID=MMETSP1437 /ASSEMBLY_ACC=CAM_ASM_001096 /LENGTH=312 /DNA_ID=CAMNT_0043429275 /DNA_START=50 /DNA_END=988 /DNA_ORIENTATION=+
MWLFPPLQKQVEYRTGDTVIAVPVKSGTTWMMNIFHQLRTGGDPDLKDIYAEVPWLEFKERPDQPNEELLERWKKIPDSVRRGFKSHSQPGEGPGDFAVYREDVKYVVLVRSPEEAIVSFKPFLEAHSKEIWKLWGMEEIRDQFLRPTFKEFYYEMALKGFPTMPPHLVPPGGLLTMFFFSFINGWWPLRNKPNVLFIHFSEMKKDHNGSVRKIADFLDFTPTDEQWTNVMEYTSFPWMKAHQEKFEIATLLPFKIIDDGGMVRNGKTGAASEDGMTPEIAADIASWAEKMVPDTAARKWLFEGGPLDEVTA